jgi:hypothetical protein
MNFLWIRENMLFCCCYNISKGQSAVRIPYKNKALVIECQEINSGFLIL